jgi:hypothetical protein
MRMGEKQMDQKIKVRDVELIKREMMKKGKKIWS